jgi:hypothetical protein
MTTPSGGSTSGGTTSGGTSGSTSGSSGSGSTSTYTEQYSGFGRQLGKDPGEGDHGFDTRNLPNGYRPPRPFNRDHNGYAQEGQDPQYLRNSDAANQADNVREGDIDGLPLPVIQQEGHEEWVAYHDAQREAANSTGTSVDPGVGTGA